MMPVGHRLVRTIVLPLCASKNVSGAHDDMRHNVLGKRETTKGNAMTTTTTTANDQTAIASGDIVCWDSGYSMCLPHFARVLRRTRCMLVVEELQSYSVLDDGHGMCGMKMPTDIGTGEVMKLRLHSGRWFATKSGNYVHRWDGKAMQYDYLD